MRVLTRSRRLRKDLRLIDVFAITTGATLSAGFFLLPGLAAAEVGPAVVLAYMIAALPLIPAMLSKVELATAMPRAGGVYYILDRALGPFVGTVGGLGIWLVLMLKVAFALDGMGAYLALFVPELPITPLAIGLAVALGALNLIGARESGRLQVGLVALLLAILAGFIGRGLPAIRPAHFEGFLDAGFSSIFATAGLVYISYVGITKIVSLSEEVENPDRTLPLGVLLSMGTALLVYALGTLIMTGVVPLDQLAGDLTPVATAAEILAGRWGAILVSGGALVAFTSVANAGTLSASRYPLAMSRDKLMPRAFRRLGRRRTPTVSVIATVIVIVAVLLFLDPLAIAKLASAFQLLTFGLVCLAVIVMRESRIESYDPGYLSPLYPWLHLLGIVAPVWLVVEMGWMPILFSLGLIAFGAAWYLRYARARVDRTGVIAQLLRGTGHDRFDRMDRELRAILKEKGLRRGDPFEEIVARSLVIDLTAEAEFEGIVDQVSGWFAQRAPVDAETIRDQLLAGTQTGATPVSHGIALPHARVEGLRHPELAIVRSRKGIRLATRGPDGDGPTEHRLSSAFFLLSPAGDAGQHLRILAQIAERVDAEDFAERWGSARNDQELKEALLLDEQFLSIRASKDGATSGLIGRALQELDLPEGTLVAIVHRDGRAIVPRGHTVLRESDRLTIIGGPDEIRALRQEYTEGSG